VFRELPEAFSGTTFNPDDQLTGGLLFRAINELNELKQSQQSNSSVSRQDLQHLVTAASSRFICAASTWRRLQLAIA
jgi:hypothetical protein